MILQSLTLRDVGVYAGEQRLEFAPPSNDRPVTLIGGLNGAGKTTLMRSLFHVLYGAHALPLIERRGSYERYLRDACRKDAGSASVELDFVVQRNSRDERITIKRSWRRNDGTPKEKVEASRDGKLDPALSDGWLDFIESILPRGIARLVFFDGEKVEALADLENASETLRTAVGSLLGLDLVDQLVLDLGVVERRRAVATASPIEQARSEELGRVLSEAEDDLARSKEDLESAAGELRVAESDLTKCEEAFRSAGGEFYERREELLAGAEGARETLREAETNARAWAVQELAPLLLVPGAVASLEAASATERETERLRGTRSVLEERDELVDGCLAELDAPQELRHKLADRLRRDRADLDDRLAEMPATLGLAPSMSLEGLQEGVLANLDSERQRSVGAIEEAQAELDQAERLSAQVPTVDSLQDLERKRSDASELVTRLRATADGLASRVGDAERKLERALRDRERHAKEIANAQLHNLDNERMLRHAEKARSTLALLRERAADQHLGRIAELAVEALEQLLRKERLIDEIAIDPASFTPTFRDRRGEPIMPDQLSAGERQLTALALLWALAQASGRPLPVLIDTPLGRLDASHRHHVVGRYMPIASRQVVILSTDTEIEGTLLDELNPHVGASYELAFDSGTEATSVIPGYLDLAAAA